MSEDQWLQIVSELATPIDFDGLVKAGVLKRRPRSKSTYQVLKFKEVPAHVWRQARTVATVTRKGQTVTTIGFRETLRKKMEKMLVEAVGVRRADELVRQVARPGDKPGR